MHQFTRLRGFQDLIGPGARTVSLVEERARAIAEAHGFREIRVPILERADLFQRTSGETSDIVEKQMYVFTDRDEAETQVALRPEGTAGVVRAYIEAGLDRSDPEQRFFYSGPMFRRERPQKGRYRQHHQFGVEVFGRADAACDAELLVLIDELRCNLGLELRFEINSIGDQTCRPAFREAVYRFGIEHEKEICEGCKRRIKTNPLRLLDCKIDAELTKSAPRSADYLCDPCRAHFAHVKELLDAAGVAYVENPRLVRGLDYYSRTTFEVISAALGAQSTVVAGGRYDGLVEALGGAQVPGIGFGIGLERVALAVEAADKTAVRKPDAAIIALGAAAARKSFELARSMRAAGLAVESMSPERKLKALLSRADKLGARFAIIIGENEIARAVVVLRDLTNSTQSEVAENAIVETVRNASKS
ncbi:MAG TPA: histidine--tRNA ligase [Candidatus Binataceae bacterium]|nr:histidine--tRNA ligase [Candidatus Binataceae bacterium]